MTKNEITTLVMSGLALVVSIASVGYDVWQDMRADDEVVSLTVDQWAGDYRFQFLGTEYSPMFPTRWGATLANNGSQSVSITSYEVLTVSDSLGLGSYTGIDLGIVSSDGRPLDLPIVLEPGHATRFVLMVGSQIKPEVFGELAYEYDIGGTADLREVRLELARSGIDIWGNPVTISGLSDDITISYPSLDSLSVPAYRLTLHSARGGSVSSEFAPYYSLF